MAQVMPDSPRDSSVVHRDYEYAVVTQQKSHGAETIQVPVDVIERLVEYDDREYPVATKYSRVSADELAILEIAHSRLGDCDVRIIDSYDLRGQTATLYLQQALSASCI
jgi:hypothetical protein